MKLMNSHWDNEDSIILSNQELYLLDMIENSYSANKMLKPYPLMLFPRLEHKNKTIIKSSSRNISLIGDQPA